MIEYRGGDEVKAKIEYNLIRSARKTISISIKNCEVIVRAPQRMKARQIERFVNEHLGWIEEHLRRAKEARAKVADIEPMSAEELAALRREAERYIPERVAYYAARLGVSYGRISIKNQLTRWGSCSEKGNLNFNCLLMLAPNEVIDAIVAHELCHLKQMNHSKRFYEKLYRLYPQYDRAKAWLREHGREIMSRNPKRS